MNDRFFVCMMGTEGAMHRGLIRFLCMGVDDLLISRVFIHLTSCETQRRWVSAVGTMRCTYAT